MLKSAFRPLRGALGLLFIVVSPLAWWPAINSHKPESCQSASHSQYVNVDCMYDQVTTGAITITITLLIGAALLMSAILPSTRRSKRLNTPKIKKG